MHSDIRIARAARIEPIEKVGAQLGIPRKYLICLGRHIAKIDLALLTQAKKRSPGKYILVTAMTPTPLGEGKTVTTIGLGMALHRLGARSSVCIRQPSLGPVFGIKGSAAGGGYAQVIPRGDFDLHFTGDAHAVGLAHNSAGAFLDNSIYRGNPHRIDLKKIYWRRAVDIGDRVLRTVKIGLGRSVDGLSRVSGFDITASSELMAILALSKDLRDLRKRLGRIVLAETVDNKPVTTEDIHVAGLMAVLLKDALKPNLIQTIENTPCFVHTGPFANIAHGNSSLIQDSIALGFSDYVVTEAGFGADCGAEKFFNIKCRLGGLRPDAAVIVCSLRALKAHAGIGRIRPGKKLDPCFTQVNVAAIRTGAANLIKHIENVASYGVPVVVAINRFSTDSEKEIAVVKEIALSAGADDCVVSEVWQRGSKGGIGLARSVMKQAQRKSSFSCLYPLRKPITDKIALIARRMYGAKGVVYSRRAREKIALYTQRGWDTLPICMAKTHLSLSHDPQAFGRPDDFVLPIRDIRAFIGAGFLSPLCGNIQTMPGLPSHPRGENIDINEKGDIIGL